jgi:protein-S-isoprenylcysteine O-methyltransferase Ste14
MTIQPMELVGAAWTAFAAFWLVEGVKAKRAETREGAGERFAHVLLMAAAFYLVAFSDSRLGKLNERFMGQRRWLADLGVAVVFVGVGFAIWARHHIGRYWSARVSIVTEHKLIRTGPYGRVRHPIYTGILMALAGTALVLGEYRGLVGFLDLSLKRGRRRRIWRRDSGGNLRSTDGGRGFCYRESSQCKGLRRLRLRLLFSIGFLDAAVVIGIDAHSIRVRIVRRAETALCATQTLEGDKR